MAAIVPAVETGAAVGGAVGTAVAGPPGAVVGAIVGGTIAGTVAIGSMAYLFFANYKNSRQQARKMAKLLKNPQIFKNQSKIAAEKLIQQLKQANLQSEILKKPNQKHVAFFGATSSGKSSLLNKLYGLKLKIGLDKTTNIAQKVYQYKNKQNNIIIWDTVGQQSSFQFLDRQNLKFILSMDIIFILYRDGITPIQFMAKLICINSKIKVYFVRTQCDQWDTSHSKSIDEVISTDFKIIQGYGIMKPMILTSSVKVQQSKHFKNQNSDILKIIEQG